MANVCNELAVVKHKLFEIGTQLKVPHGKLMEFKKRDDFLSATIQYWLCGNVDKAIPSWETIVTALKSNHVAEPGLANEIYQKCCHREVEG